MPHSGGGGSHSGGSHDGGGGGGSVGSSRPAMSRRPYSGCHSYVYYYNDKPHVYYADRVYDPKSDASAKILCCIVIMIVFLIVMMQELTICFGKLPLTYIHNIYIQDEVGLIKDDRAMTQYLEEFRDKSGITVSIVTEHTYDTTMGESFTMKAKNKYMELWDDESHWLIYYVGDEKDRTDDWKWELMCGDDCLKVLPQSQEDLFTDEFHRRLVAYERFAFDEAVKQSLDSLTVYSNVRLALKESYNPVDFVFFAIIGIVLFIISLFMISPIITLTHPSARKRAQMEATEFKGEKQEYKCPYCDRIYIRNQTYSCPYCGGPAE